MGDARIVTDRELGLRRPEVRRDPVAVRALLAPDFIEVDAHGRVWDVNAVVKAIAFQKGYVAPMSADPQASRIAPDVQLLTYRDETRVHSSLWTRNEEGEWLLRFHQQTLVVE